MDHECPLGLSTSLDPVMGGYERSDAFFLAVVGASADRSADGSLEWSGDSVVSRTFSAGRGEIEWRKNWSGRWVVIAGTGNVAAVWNVDGNSVSWSSGRSRLWNFIREKRNSAGAVFYRWLCADSLGDDHMKRQWNRKKGRFVLEASILVPMICILLVYLVYFTLYTHDCAVVTHGILESGVKGIYRDGRSDEVIREQMQEDLSRKLSGRLLWMEDAEVEARVGPLQAEVKVSGKGRFLPAQIEIKTVEKLYRVRPCKVIRRSRWMIRSGEE